MVRRRMLIALGAIAVVAVAGVSFAVAAAVNGPPTVPQTKRFHAELNGYQETPAVSTTGFGTFDAWLVEDGKLHYVLRYDGLEGGNTLFAHVHFGTRYVAGGVSFFLCGGSTKPEPCPNVGGVVEGDVTAADVIGPNNQGIEPLSFDEILRAMRAGDAYANVHTTRWGTGEIRGQINDRDQRELE